VHGAIGGRQESDSVEEGRHWRRRGGWTGWARTPPHQEWQSR